MQPFLLNNENCPYDYFLLNKFTTPNTIPSWHGLIQHARLSCPLATWAVFYKMAPASLSNCVSDKAKKLHFSENIFIYAVLKDALIYACQYIKSMASWILHSLNYAILNDVICPIKRKNFSPVCDFQEISDF